MTRRNSFLLLLALIIVIVGIVSFIITRNKAENSGARSVVVMNTGQTYFGYLSDTNKPFVTLRDVYYPQDPASVRNTNPDVKKRVSLFRYGDEVYGPVSVMKIDREDIVYYSVMRADSKINTAIEEYLSGQNDVTPTDSPSPAQQ